MNSKNRILKLLLLCVALIALFTVSVCANIIGDVDGNGKAEAADARLALRKAVGLETLSAEAESAADVDVNGKVEAADARLILRAAVGLETLEDKRVAACEHTYKWVAEKNEKRVVTGYHYQQCTKCGNIANRAACSYGEKEYKTEATVATCTKSVRYIQTCSVCSHAKTYSIRAKGHQWYPTENTNKNKVAPGMEYWQEYKCTVCGETEIRYTVTEDSLPLTLQFFNSNANLLKAGGYKFSGFTSYESQTAVNTDKTAINYSTTMKLLAKYFGEDFSQQTMLNNIIDSMENDDSYNSLMTSAPIDITNDNLYLSGTSSVSELTLDDITACQKSQVKGLDFLGNLDSNIQIKTGSGSVKYDISKYATDAELLKITLTLKTESLDELRKTDAKSSMQHITDTDLRQLAKLSFNESDIGVVDSDDMDTNMTCTCQGATSAGQVTYYFDMETGAPVAAVYDTTFDIHEFVTFSFKINASDLGLNLDFSEDLMSGTIDFSTTNHSVEYYFFSK